MEFNEQKALEYIEHFNLDPNTLNVWRSRGAIPDKYGKDVLPEKASGEADEQFIRELKRINKVGKINMQPLSRLVKVDPQRIASILSDTGARANKDELLAVKKGIQMLRIEAKEIVSLFNRQGDSEIAATKLKKFLTRTEIKSYCLFENKQTGKYMADWILGKRSILPATESEILKALMTFITETTML